MAMQVGDQAPDFALKNHRFYLDDELIADSGKIIPDYLND